jgi:hypothetical protein
VGLSGGEVVVGMGLILGFLMGGALFGGVIFGGGALLHYMQAPPEGSGALRWAWYILAHFLALWLFWKGAQLLILFSTGTSVSYPWQLIDSKVLFHRDSQ